MTLTHLLIISLATWRIASLLVREDGPFHVFCKLREMAGIEHDEDGIVFIIPSTFWAQLLSCVWCSSMWTALLWLSFWLIWPDAAVICATGFAVSAGAILVEEITN